MTVAIDRSLCLNDNYKRIDCRRCATACPKGCFAEASAGAPCDDCGLCLAACPVDAVESDGYPSGPLARLLDDPAAPVLLACRKRREGSPWPCLGFLDGRLLLALAVSGKGGARSVAVDDSACAACRPEVAARLAEVFAEVDRLLLPAGKPPLVRGEAASRAAQVRPISRRAFFAEVFGATVETVREVMTAGTGVAERLPRHEWFTRHVRGDSFAAGTPSPLFASLTISEACLACGLCIRICPCGALTAEDHGTFLDFYHHPGRCAGCGLCAAHCPQQAMTVGSPGLAAAYRVARRELPRCAVCGLVYQPVGNQPVCIECYFKGTDRRVIFAEDTQEVNNT